MRATQVCPKCQGRKLYVVDPVRMPDQENNTISSIPFCAGFVDGTKVQVGNVEAWVCATCTYVEYYAKNATKMLASLATQPGGNVRYLDGSGGPSGPFR
jgi:predicted nucleic-acid-binding Zn-ribbon protein